MSQHEPQQGDEVTERAELENKTEIFFGQEMKEQPGGWGKVGDSQGWEFSQVSAVIPALPLAWAAGRQPLCPLGHGTGIHMGML